jgi:16S rRNA (cytosine967-C5)-methyltransferase
VVAIVELVLRQCSRDKPADAVLRGELRRQAGLASHLSAAAVDAVFAWHRWRRWLDSSRPLSLQIPDAVELDERFRSDPASFSDEELMARCIPEWTKEQLEISSAWVRTLQSAPRLWLRARVDQGAELAGRLGQCFVPPACGDAVEYRGGEDLFRSPEFQAGDFEVQDLSSQAVGWLCDPKSGETWWDACAGEGGKMLHLSDLMQNRGLIWASDRAPWRLKRLKLRAARARAFNYRAAIWEGGARLPTKTKFDGVLLDAPCSGVGTWQRNPHARWTTTADDVRELAGLQAALLGHAAPAVKPGGKLVYAVCTLTRSETIEVVDSFEQRFPEFQRLPLINPLGANSTATHGIWLWPQDVGGNGMFVVAWQREKTKPATS